MCLIHISEAPSLTEDNLLRLQMEQFEHMRRQMEEKQKKQLEEMLQRQQQVLRLKKNLSLRAFVFRCVFDSAKFKLFIFLSFFFFIPQNIHKRYDRHNRKHWDNKFRKKYTSGPRYWNVPVLMNTGTFLVYQYCLKM